MSTARHRTPSRTGRSHLLLVHDRDRDYEATNPRDHFHDQRDLLAARLAPRPFTFPAALRLDPAATGWLLVTLVAATGIHLNPRARRHALNAVRSTAGCPPCTRCTRLTTVETQPTATGIRRFRCDPCGHIFRYNPGPVAHRDALHAIHPYL